MDRTTDELLKLMKSADSYDKYHEDNKHSFKYMKPNRALNALLESKTLKKSEVIAASGLETHYAYQIFSGVKTPSRDKVIMLCFGMKLSFEETQDLLKISGFKTLYAKDERDNALIFGFLHSLSVIEMNSLLYELKLELLL